MKAAQLRQSILQAAVQGKLVPQDTHDEPADKLLERIRAEKARLVRDGKIKKETPLPPIAEEDAPYDLPDGWVWCRLGDVALLITSGSRGWAKYYSSSGAIFLRMGNLSKDSYNLRLHSIQYVTPPKSAEGNRTKLEPNDLLVSITGEVGNLGLIPKDFCEAYINQHTALVRFPFELQNFFFPTAFLSPLCKEQFAAPQRGIKNSFRLTDLSYMLIPLPPIAEQQRIVAKANELMTLCDELETAEKELDKLEADFAEYLPKSILQAAVQGKLVPQNIHDEPADKLLERIRAEKARLLKEGKIKKGKALPPITEDEKPYDLPEGWIWCRLSDVAEFKIGKTPARAESIYWDNGVYPWVSIADMKSGEHLSFTKEKVSQQAHDKVFKGSMVPEGSLLFSFKLSIGKVSILDVDAFTNEAICSITPYGESELVDFLFRIFPALDLMSGANDAIKGKTLNSKSIANIMIPLPPLAEQQRIVAKVDELMALCDELKAAKNIIPVPSIPKVIPFPTQDDECEEIGIAARGDVQGLSDEAMRDIDELFGDEAND